MDKFKTPNSKFIRLRLDLRLKSTNKNLKGYNHAANTITDFKVLIIEITKCQASGVSHVINMPWCIPFL
jgi:hypothetical protein